MAFFLIVRFIRELQKTWAPLEILRVVCGGKTIVSFRVSEMQLNNIILTRQGYSLWKLLDFAQMPNNPNQCPQYTRL